MGSFVAEWRDTTLGELLLLQRGIDLPERLRRPGRYAVLGSNGPVGSHDEAPVRGPGVVIGRATNLGRPTYWSDDFWPLNTCLYVKDFRGLDPRYVYYLFESLDLSGFDSGSVQPMLNRNYIAGVPLRVPDLAEQREIAGVLGALDDKIESNRRQCKILDELALTTCKKLFRSDLESDMGPRLGDVASITLGGTPSRSRPEFWDDGRIAWINSGALHERPLITASDMITDEGLRRSATKIVPSGSTVVAITGATLGVVSRLGIDAAINQSVVGIYVPDSRELTDYIYIWMRLNIARLVSSATGAAQQHVNKSNFEELQVSAPDETGLQSMIEVSSLLDAQTALSRQNKSLVALRDSLLPELLSGRLRVRDAEKVVEGVV